MSLRHAILGILAIEPMSGYDLKKVIDQSVAHFWQADQSQVYRTLATLVSEGLATRRTVLQDDRPNMHVHTATGLGLAELDDWLTSPLPTPVLREPFLARLFFAGRLPREDVLRLLAERRRVVEEALAALEAVAADVAAEASTPDGLGPVLRLATLDYGLVHDRAELSWLDATTERIQRAAP